MHKVMVFIDYQNFFISWKWKNRGRKPPFVDYQKLGRLINRQIPLDSEVIKTYLFAYKPCEELMLLEPYQRYYNWLNGMKKTPYLEAVEVRKRISGAVQSEEKYEKAKDNDSWQKSNGDHI